jgi:E3 ubiquitin-protein ligase synoviolin
LIYLSFFTFQLVFGFEYAVLLTIIASTLVKYTLHSVDLHSENPWDNKAVFMLYTELAIGFTKVKFNHF